MDEAGNTDNVNVAATPESNAGVAGEERKFDPRTHPQQQHQNFYDNSHYPQQDIYQQPQQHYNQNQLDQQTNHLLQAELEKVKDKLKQSKKKRKREYQNSDSEECSNDDDDDDEDDFSRSDPKIMVQDIRDLRRRKDDNWKLNGLQETSKLFDLLQVAIDLKVSYKKISLIIQKILDAHREADDSLEPNRVVSIARKTIKKLQLPRKLKKKLSEIFKTRAATYNLGSMPAHQPHVRQQRHFASSSSSSSSQPQRSRPTPMLTRAQIAHNGKVCGFCTRAGLNSPDCFILHPEKKPGYIAPPAAGGYDDLSSLLFPLSIILVCSFSLLHMNCRQ